MALDTRGNKSLQPTDMAMACTGTQLSFPQGVLAEREMLSNSSKATIKHDQSRLKCQLETIILAFPSIF